MSKGELWKEEANKAKAEIAELKAENEKLEKALAKAKASNKAPKQPKAKQVMDGLTIKIAKQGYGGRNKRVGYRAQIFDGDNMIMSFNDYCKTAAAAAKIAEVCFGRKLPAYKG